MAFTNPVDAPDGVVAASFGTGVLIANPAFAIPTAGVQLPSAPGVGPAWYVGSGVGVQIYINPADSAHPINLELDYYATAAALVALASQQWGKGTNTPTLDVVPILGPFLRVSLSNAGLNATTASLSIVEVAGGGVSGGLGGALGTNRLLASLPNTAVGAGASQPQPMAANIPGPASLTVISFGQPFQVQIQGTAGVSNNKVLAVVTTDATNPEAITVPVNLPNDDWEILAHNNGAAGANVLATVTSGR